MTPGDSFYLYSIGTVSSAGLERCLDRAEVAGSNPARFTIFITSYHIQLFSKFQYLHSIDCSLNQILPYQENKNSQLRTSS